MDGPITGLMPPVVSRPRPWHRLYFGLALLDVLTVALGLWLSHQLVGIQVGSVSASAAMAELRREASTANAPGNDVFESGDVPGELARLEAAATGFAAALKAARSDDELHAAGVDVALLEQPVTDMIRDGRAIMQALQRRDRAAAGRLMAAMDRSYARFSGAMDRADGQLRDFQLAQARRYQQVELLIAALVIVMVTGALVYGRRMGRVAAQMEEARVAHVAQMELARQAALDSARLKSEFLANMSH